MILVSLDYNFIYREIYKNMDEKIKFIQRQTNYKEPSFIESKLKEYDNDEMKVIEEYLEIQDDNKKEENISSVQQSIFKEIRGFMESIQMKKSN